MARKDTKSHNIALKKESFLLAYQKSFGNITIACEAIGIGRRTYYDWLEADEEFKEKVQNTEPDERFIDMAENALQKKIIEGDTTAIIFTLKTKGKKRGYIERTEQTVVQKDSFKDVSDEELEKEIKRLNGE